MRNDNSLSSSCFLEDLVSTVDEVVEFLKVIRCKSCDEIDILIVKGFVWCLSWTENVMYSKTN
jgi:hypothetical protein